MVSRVTSRISSDTILTGETGKTGTYVISCNNNWIFGSGSQRKLCYTHSSRKPVVLAGQIEYYITPRIIFWVFYFTTYQIQCYSSQASSAWSLLPLQSNSVTLNASHVWRIKRRDSYMCMVGEEFSESSYFYEHLTCKNSLIALVYHPSSLLFDLWKKKKNMCLECLCFLFLVSGITISQIRWQTCWHIL